jgi:hypothetical protein
MAAQQFARLVPASIIFANRKAAESGFSKSRKTEEQYATAK